MSIDLKIYICTVLFSLLSTMILFYKLINKKDCQNEPESTIDMEGMRYIRIPISDYIMVLITLVPILNIIVSFILLWSIFVNQNVVKAQIRLKK